MKNFTIGGVPEHFNLPWHLSIEQNEFDKENISLSWMDFPGGTGAMCEALRNDKIDLAIILTEGIVKDIIQGNPSKIIQTYIQSPLIWGVHVAYRSTYQSLEQIENKTAAISRKGSGSHLMSYVLAQKNNWDTANLNFNIVKNLNGAVERLTQGKADYFLWEHFTTKPLVDQKVFRRIADCPTPWPCFVIAAREEILKKYPEEIKSILSIINKCTSSFKSIPEIDLILAKRYDQKIEDIRAWLKITEWSQEIMSANEIEKVQKQLFELQLIDKYFEYDDLTRRI